MLRIGSVSSQWTKSQKAAVRTERSESSLSPATRSSGPSLRCTLTRTAASTAAPQQCEVVLQAPNFSVDVAKRQNRSFKQKRPRSEKSAHCHFVRHAAKVSSSETSRPYTAQRTAGESPECELDFLAACARSTKNAAG